MAEREGHQTDRATNAIRQRFSSRRREKKGTSDSKHGGPQVSPRSQTEAVGVSQFMDLSSLDMLRSGLCLWILLFHSLCFIAPQMTDAEARRISMGFAYGGYIAVDGFLVLTGFLVSMPYVKMNSKLSMAGKSYSDKFHFVVDQHYKRFVRIVPPLAVVFILHCFIVFPNGTQELVRQRQLSGQIAMRRLAGAEPTSRLGNNCENAWGAFFFINHLQPFGGTLMHLWSLAVQYQFYLLLPIIHVLFDLSHGRRFLYVTLGFTIVAFLFRMLTLFYFHSLPVNSIMQSAMDFHVYSFTLNRIHSIWIGGLAAWIMERQPSAIRWLRADSLGSRITHLALLSFGSFYVLWNCFANEIGVPKSISYSLFMHVGSVGSAIIWCYLIYLVGSKHKSISWIPDSLSSVIDRLCKHKLWTKLAQLSYIIFLIHPVLFIRLYSDPSLLMPPSKQDVPSPFVVLRDGVSTSASLANALQHGSQNYTTSPTDEESSIEELRSGFPRSATAFLDDDEWEAFEDPTFANTTRSLWKMIDHLERPVGYQGPVIPGTESTSLSQFLLYTWIALLVIVLTSEVVRRLLVDPVTKMLFSAKGVMRYVVVVHSIVCIALSVTWHGLWMGVPQYLTPDLEATHPIAQYRGSLKW